MLSNGSIVPIRLVYLHGTAYASAERSVDSIVLIPEILDEYSIRGEYTFINVTDSENVDDYTALEEYMSRYTDSIILIVTALGSGPTQRVVQYLDSRGYTNYLMLNSFSTLDSEVLNQSRVMRVLPRDGSNVLLFKAMMDRVSTDWRLLLVDEDNIWATGLADEIEIVIPNILRYSLDDIVDGSVQLPQGSMSIIALAEPALPRLMEVLPSRSNDVRLLLLGDADAGTRPSSARELQYLTAWTTRMIVPRTNSNTIDIFRSRTGLTNISNLFGPLVSVLQLAAYLKYSTVHDYRVLMNSEGQLEALYLLPIIRNYYMGIELDEDTLDSITGIFDIVYFTAVDLPATAIDDVGISILDDGRVRMYIGTEVTA